MKEENVARDRVKALVESQAFRLFILVVIVVNAITIGIETNPPSHDASVAFDAFDLICLGIYVIEAGLKLYAYRSDYFKDGWNVFDFIILASFIPTEIVPMPVQIARTARVFRVARVLKIVARFPQMRIVVESIVRSFKGVIWTLALLLLIVYVFDVAGVFLFAERCPEYFGDLTTGMWSLFQMVTLEGWPEISRGIMEEYHNAWLYFVPFIVLSSFIMVNIVLGIIINTVEESRQADRVAPGSTEQQLAEELDDLKKQIETVQRLLDKSNAERNSRL